MEAKITIYTGGTITGFSLPYDPVDRIHQLQSDLAEAEKMLIQCHAFILSWIPNEPSPMRQQFANMLKELDEFRDRAYFTSKAKREKEEGNA
jgi:hypothetical protein